LIAQPERLGQAYAIDFTQSRFVLTQGIPDSQ
jgi:hypothetical protein